MSALEDEKTIHDIEVEITDLDPLGTTHKVFGIRIIHGQQLPFQARWFQLLLTIMGGVALLFLLLANMPHASKATRPGGTPAFAQPTFVPRSLSLLDGVMYVLVTDGNMNALRVSDGSLLWHHKGLVDAYPVATTNGVVFLVEQQSGTVDALRVIDGTLLWQYKPRMGVTWPTVANGIIYVGDGNQVKALRASDGTVIWQQKLAVSGFWVTNGVVYAVPDFGNVGAFRGSSGTPLWRHKIDGLILGVDNRMIYLGLWDHSVAALLTSDGSLLWHQNMVQTDTLASRTDGALYFLTHSGELDALSGSSGSFLWHKHYPRQILRTCMCPLTTRSSPSVFQMAMKTFCAPAMALCSGTLPLQPVEMSSD